LWNWGASPVATIDVSNPREPRVVSHAELDGFGDGVTVQNGYLYASTGHHSRGGIDTGIDLADKFSWMHGAAAVGDRLLATSDGGYRLVPALSTGLEQTPTIRAERGLSGKITVCGDLLFVIRRNASRVAIVDIWQIESPRLLGELETDGNPNAAVVRDNALLIPDGYNGLLIYDGLLATLESED